MYARSSANPHFDPVAEHHLFDGDDMAHALRICNGAAETLRRYASRFTDTERLRQEHGLCRLMFPTTIGELHGHSGMSPTVRGIFVLRRFLIPSKEKKLIQRGK